VAVGVLVGVRVGVAVGVLVGVLVGVRVGVAVGVLVGVRVGVAVGVLVAVRVGLTVGVLVGVLVLVGATHGFDRADSCPSPAAKAVRVIAGEVRSRLAGPQAL
jgi:hypothetical protein